MSTLTTRLKVILGVLALVAGFMVVRVGTVLTDNAKSAKMTANISETVNGDFDTGDPMKVDTDKDGLSDRDEIIYGSDPFEKDTDGDGYIDGEEIASGYDPVDSSDNPKSGPSGNSLSLISPTANLTDRILNMGLASMIDSSGTLDPQQMDTQKFADILTSVENEAAMYLSANQVTDSDVIIGNDNSAKAIERYIDTISNIVEEGIFAPTGQMLAGNADEIVGLSTEKNYYENKYNALKLVEVPSSWKEIHKTTLVDLATLANSTKALTQISIDADPIKASYALNKVQDSFLSLINLLSEATKLAQTQNVPLKDSILDALNIAGQSQTSIPSLTPLP